MKWATIERQFLNDEVKWLKAGAKWVSPSGEDISAMKLEEIRARLEHVQLALNQLKAASGGDPMADIMREMGKTPQERSS